ncbi:porin family protein [Chitinophaga silvatica]|nr:porin family protein [Chitinophaga silvatica]
MKKVLLSMAALLVATITFGQVQWGIVAGPQFSSIQTRNLGLSNNREATRLVTNLRAGFTVDIPFAPGCYIGTGILYSGKGGKFKNSDVRANISYLEAPIQFMYKPDVGYGRMVLAVGPYVAVGVGGKVKNTAFGSLDIYNDEALLMRQKRFDSGASVGVGYELPVGLFFGLNGDIGLVNTAYYTDNDRKFHNYSFGVSVGYKFGR